MLSFKFILLLFFGLFMQTVLATSYGPVSDVVTLRDDDNASQAPGNGFVTAVSDFGDDTSGNGLHEMTTGTSSVDTLPNRKPKGCWGMCSPSDMCLCRNKSVRVYCYCETPGKKCSCGRDALASRDVIEVDATDTVVDEGTVTDAGVGGADISDAVPSDAVPFDAVPSDDPTSEDIDSSDEDTSPISILSNKGKQQCHGKCTKCLGNCKDKFQCLCKGRDVVARCGCERLGEKCQCKGPWRAVRGVTSVNSTTADELESATPSVDVAADDLDGAAIPVPGVSLISDSELMESKPTTCHGVMCSKDGKCHCKHGPYNIVCPCHRLGAPCYCKNWRRDDDDDDVSGSVDAAVAETVDTTSPATPVADDNTPTPEDEDTEASSQPGFSHAVNDEFSTLQRTCYGTCSRKHKCNCRGKTCRCQIPGESCKCVFPFLPPRELESIPTFPGDEAEAEVDDTVITSPAPIEDIATSSAEDTVIPSNINEITPQEDKPLNPEEDATDTETATSPIETENSPLLARGEPCWGVCDKYRHCYCGHIRTNCNCSKRGHRCYCASGPNDLPPGMGSGVTY
ncbi:hypothetical protein ASPACDRAFT_118657 [Aspergillus aculeatus ATCC 16872]|uniref:EGF-like domain-containing protein n=1 Tax=Aspergillus aculeatus (strain ATCC 16872 / CBS 172.66 / WB 5094) TaxID=690307 RepID=A0A1L9WVZ1_ASPA1|nr:uncharacterized protein ASPACDRAFT_118657 [Aspergillus aculeatus ATCC 16872]OJK00411.1 hypothetical protein ASPACDRAFT_118657 [Aspergillus aculeatus ATCC 16872]